MSKIIDITDKLTFEENPKIKVKDMEIEVNTNALDLISVAGVMAEGVTPDAVQSICEKLFATSEDTEKVYSLRLSYKDFITFIQECLAAVMSGDDAGEAPTPAMT